ncbi:MAG: hypothetical protein HY301_21035 [Verrucomicrobia bacterium]|nr:hypothetical protein [Verrucomicrobiota bacterium]
MTGSKKILIVGAVLLAVIAFWLMPGGPAKGDLLKQHLGLEQTNEFSASLVRFTRLTWDPWHVHVYLEGHPDRIRRLLIEQGFAELKGFTAPHPILRSVVFANTPVPPTNSSVFTRRTGSSDWVVVSPSGSNFWFLAAAL